MQKNKSKNFIQKIATFISQEFKIAREKDFGKKCLAQFQSEQFMIKAGQKVREKPTKIPDDEIILGVKLIFEEALEIAEACGVDVKLRISQDSLLSSGINKGQSIIRKIREGELEFETNGSEQDLIEIGDGISDLKYVAHGLANRVGVVMKPLDNEVHRSNMSKFIDGHRREDGKWIKGSSYSPANIKSLINEQKNQ